MKQSFLDQIVPESKVREAEFPGSNSSSVPVDSPNDGSSIDVSKYRCKQV